MKNKVQPVARNAKVAKKRGSTWRKKLVLGKHDAAANPSMVRMARLKKGVAQDRISSHIGTSLATYGSIERGLRPVEMERAEKIARLLKTPVKRLFKSGRDGKLVAIKSQSL